jgi:hypothetical protein
LVAALSTLIASVAAGLAWRRWRQRESPTVRLIEASRSINEVLRLRGTAKPGAAGALTSGALALEPLDEIVVRRFFPAFRAEHSDLIFDPHCWVARAGPQDFRVQFAEHPEGWIRRVMNSRGLREEREFAACKPGLRVLFAGDSHTDGACNTNEAFVHLLERDWKACHPGYELEAINGGLGGYSPYNYLGLIDTLADLVPDVYVVVVYGGNDFAEMMPLQRYFERRGPLQATASLDFAKEHRELRGPLAQEVFQALYFAANPEDVAQCVATMSAISVAIERKCAARGCRLLFAYLPPAFVTQPQFFAEALARTREFVAVDDEMLAVSEHIADAWLASLREHGLAAVDLRPALHAAEEICYWRTEHHINLAGNRVVADELLPAIDALLER